MIAFISICLLDLLILSFISIVINSMSNNITSTSIKTKRKYTKKKKRGRKSSSNSKHPKQIKKNKHKVLCQKNDSKKRYKHSWTSKLTEWIKKNHQSLMQRSKPLPNVTELSDLIVLTTHKATDIIKWMKQNTECILFKIDPSYDSQKKIDNSELLIINLTDWIIQNSNFLIQRDPPYPSRVEYNHLSNLYNENKNVIQRWFRDNCKRILIEKQLISADKAINYYLPIIQRFIRERCGELWLRKYTASECMLHKISSVAKISYTKAVEIMTPENIKGILNEEFKNLVLLHRIINDLLFLKQPLNEDIITRLSESFDTTNNNIQIIYNDNKQRYNEIISARNIYSCNKCNYYFKSSRELCLHQSIPHGYACKHCPLKFTHQFSRRTHVNLQHNKTLTCPKCLMVKTCKRGVWKKHCIASHDVLCQHAGKGCKLRFARVRDMQLHLKKACAYVFNKKNSEIFLVIDKPNETFIETGDAVFSNNVNVVHGEEERFDIKEKEFKNNILRIINSCGQLTVDLSQKEYNIESITSILLELSKYKFIALSYLLDIQKMSGEFNQMELNALKILFVACSINCKHSIYNFIDGISEIDTSEILKQYKIELSSFNSKEIYQDIFKRDFDGNFYLPEEKPVNYQKTFRLFPNIYLSSTAQIFNDDHKIRCKITFDSRKNDRNFIDCHYVDKGRIMINRIYSF